MGIRGLLGAALTVTAVAGGLLLLTAEQAVACTCAVSSEATSIARADAVFVGELVGRRARPPASTSPSGGRFRPAPVVLTFKVSRVVKGAVSERQEIVTPGGGEGNCEGFGVGLHGPGPFLVVAFGSAGDRYQLEPGQYASNLCSGSRAVADGGAALVGGPTGAQLVMGIGLAVVGAAALVAILRTRRRSGTG